MPFCTVAIAFSFCKTLSIPPLNPAKLASGKNFLITSNAPFCNAIKATAAAVPSKEPSPIFFKSEKSYLNEFSTSDDNPAPPIAGAMTFEFLITGAS